MKHKILQRLAIFTSTTAMIMSGIPISAAPRTINSYGIVTATDPDTGATVTIDADDIRNNYAAIYQIQQQLSGLDGKTLEWSDELGTYVIKTYKTDENGNVVLDDDGNPIVESEEAIGALGTADPTMVVENRTFSSLYAKTIYNGDSTLKAPGVQQNGTLVDVLGNGFTSKQINGRASYADNDTIGTGSSTRNKDSAVTDTTGGDRTDKLNVGHVQYTDPAKTLKEGVSASAPSLSNGSALNANNGSYSSASNGKFTLSKDNTKITLGINESVTLPAGYYSKNVTLNNGVTNNTETARATISGTVGSIDTKDNNKTFADGNMDITNASGTYDINKWNSTNDALNLGAKASVVLPSGYYAKDILIQNTVKDILGADYDSEDGTRYLVKTHNAASSSNGNNSTTNVDINDSDNQDITLGINESVTLPAGYYSKEVTLNNGVADTTTHGSITVNGTIGAIDSKETDNTITDGNAHITTADETYAIAGLNDSDNPVNIGAGASFTFPVGYYSKAIKVQNTVKDILGSKYDSENGTRYVVKSYDAATSSNGNNSTTNVDIDDEDNQDITLGINESVTLPAGYYSKEVTLNNGVADTTAHGSITIAGTIGGIDANEADTTIADGNAHITYKDNTYAVSGLDDTANSIKLGAGASFTFPVGYYSKAIKVTNTVKDILDGDIANVRKNSNYQPDISVQANNGTSSDTDKLIRKKGEDSAHTTLTLGINDSVTLPAGYYSEDVTLRNGVYNNMLGAKAGISGTIGANEDEELDRQVDPEANNSSMRYGNKAVTKANNEDYALSAWNSSSNPLNLGAGGKITLPAGYYSKAILIQNTVKDILGDTTVAQNTHEFYQPDNNAHGTSSDVARLTETHTDLTLGVNDSVTLPAGYYSDAVTIKNGVRNNVLTDDETKTTANITGTIGTVDNKEDNSVTSAGNLNITKANGSYTLGDFNATNNPLTLGAGASINLPAGYYDNLTITNSVKDILGVASLPKNVKGTYQAVTDNNGTVNDHAALSNTDTSITLGVNEKTTLPAGYYSKEVTINNGVADRGSVENRIDSVDSNDIPGGYYVPSSLANSTKYQTLVTTLGDILGKPWGTGTGETIPTLATINGENGFGSFDTSALQKVTAVTGKAYTGGDNSFLGTNGRNGTETLESDATYPVISDTNGIYQLGAGEQLVFPAGFYAKSQTVQNGAKIIKSATVASDANIDTDNAGNNTGDTTLSQTANTTINLGIEKKVTLPAGYYTKDVVVNNSVINRGTSNATLSVTNLTKNFEAGYYDKGSVSIEKSSIQTNSGTELNTKDNWSQGLDAGQSITLTAGAIYNGTITANKMTETYSASTSSSAFTVASGKAIWDMGDTNMNRSVTIPTTSASATSLAAGSSATIKAGFVTSDITIAANKMTKTYYAATSGSALKVADGKATWDMGDTNMNRYVTVPTTSASATSLAAGSSATIKAGFVPSDITITAKKNTETYTFPVNDTGTQKDLGETTAYRYVNATNVYDKGKADGVSETKKGNATAEQVLAGQYFTSASAGVNVKGTMKNNGKVTKTLDTTTTTFTIAKGYHDGTGTVSIGLETKTVTPSTSEQNITPTSGKVLSKVTVNKVPTQEKSATPTGSAQNITPDSGKFLSKVTVAAVTKSSGIGKTLYDEGYNAGVTKGHNDVKNSPGSYLTATTYNKITGNANTGVQTYDITQGYYNKVMVDQTASYNAGQKSIKDSVVKGTISASSSTKPATTLNNENIPSNVYLDKDKKLVVKAGYTDGFTVQNVASGGSDIQNTPNGYVNASITTKTITMSEVQESKIPLPNGATESNALCFYVIANKYTTHHTYRTDGWEDNETHNGWFSTGQNITLKTVGNQVIVNCHLNSGYEADQGEYGGTDGGWGHVYYRNCKEFVDLTIFMVTFS